MTYNKNVYFTIGQFYWLLSYTRPTRNYSSSTLPFTFHTQSLHIQHQDYQLPSQASHSYPFVWLTVWMFVHPCWHSFFCPSIVSSRLIWFHSFDICWIDFNVSVFAFELCPFVNHSKCHRPLLMWNDEQQGQLKMAGVNVEPNAHTYTSHIQCSSSYNRGSEIDCAIPEKDIES